MEVFGGGQEQNDSGILDRNMNPSSTRRGGEDDGYVTPVEEEDAPPPKPPMAPRRKRIVATRIDEEKNAQDFATARRVLFPPKRPADNTDDYPPKRPRVENDDVPDPAYSESLDLSDSNDSVYEDDIEPLDGGSDYDEDEDEDSDEDSDEDDEDEDWERDTASSSSSSSSDSDSDSDSELSVEDDPAYDSGEDWLDEDCEVGESLRPVNGDISSPTFAYDLKAFLRSVGRNPKWSHSYLWDPKCVVLPYLTYDMRDVVETPAGTLFHNFVESYVLTSLVDISEEVDLLLSDKAPHPARRSQIKCVLRAMLVCVVASAEFSILCDVPHGILVLWERYSKTHYYKAMTHAICGTCVRFPIPLPPNIYAAHGFAIFGGIHARLFGTRASVPQCEAFGPFEAPIDTTFSDIGIKAVVRDPDSDRKAHVYLSPIATLRQMCSADLVPDVDVFSGNKRVATVDDPVYLITKHETLRIPGAGSKTGPLLITFGW